MLRGMTPVARADTLAKRDKTDQEDGFMIRTRFATGALALVFTAATAASATYYDLGKNGDNKSNVSWESRASVELIVGRTNKVSGYVYFDDRPANRNARHAVEITIPVTSMQTGIASRDQHMAGADWLDAEKHPNIVFRSVSITPVRGKPNTFKIVGDMTIHGVTKRVTTTGTAQRLAAIPRLERSGYVGDIIHLVTKFPIKLADYGINVPEGILGTKMADQVTIQFDVFGFTNNDPGRTPASAATPATPASPAAPATPATPAAPPATQPAR
jgi:polyisoprenoid-binding protein YceI